MSSLAKTEFPTYQDGQNAALWLTAALWALVILALLGLRWAIGSQSLGLMIPTAGFVFVLIGWAQASLSNGFHEAVHKNFGANHKDWISLATLGYPTFFTMQYRTIHLQHHLKAGDPKDDPDFGTYAGFPRSRFEMLGRFFLMGSGIAAAKQLLTKNLRSGEKVTGRKRSNDKSSVKSDLFGLLAVQIAIAGIFMALFGLKYGALYYVGFWILPLGMVAKLAKSTRSFCEHGSPDHDYVLRTITGKPWQTGTLGMYGFHYHAEHHLYPWVAYARLAALHDRIGDELLANPETREGPYELFDKGYFGLLLVWFKDLPWTRPKDSETSAA